jgi:hypothetical protein
VNENPLTGRVAIVCTNKGTHQRKELLKIGYREDGSTHVAESGSTLALWGVNTSYANARIRPEPWPGIEFFCPDPSCTRNPRISTPRWRALLVAYAPSEWPRLGIKIRNREGVPEADLDISLLESH